MMKTRLAGLWAGLALACMSVPALAQDTGAYIGGSFGQTTANGFCSDVRDIVVTVFGGTVPSCDEKDNGFKIFGGYRFNRNLAVEGSYFDYGEFPSRISIGGNSGTLTGEATAFGAAALGILPINDRFSVFGKAGILVTTVDITVVVPGGVGVADEDDTGLHFGLGAVFDVTRNFGVRAEWERNDEADIDMLSVGVQVRF